MVTARQPYKKRLIILAIIALLLVIMQWALPGHPGNVNLYTTYIFRPFQYLRNIIFGNIPLSLGDIFYLSAGISILVLLIKWIFFIARIRTYKPLFILSLLRTLLAATIIYFVFFLGWAGNYYKPSLSELWKIQDSSLQNDSTLYAFDSYLIGRLNSYAPHYHAISFKEVAKRSVMYYQTYTDIPSPLMGLRAKPSLFGTLLQYMGVQGYYNPFTGEAQVNSNLPDFILPFVVCHELAHQSGIAAEDDANLLAYAVGTSVKDSTFNYSCYFNLWLYTHSKLRMRDTASAKYLYKTLNQLSVSHLDTLKAINKRYRSKLSHYSSGWYDGYLRFHHVKDGIDSYDDVVQTAYTWEQQIARRKDSLIHIP